MGIGQELAAVAEETAGGNQEFQTHPAAHGVHGHELALSLVDLVDDSAHGELGHVGHQPLHRLAHLAVDLLGQHTGGGHLELVALAAHGLDEDGQVHLAAARHVERVGALLGDPQGHVLQEFLFQTVAEVSRSDELALAAGKGGVVDGEGHFDGGLADLDEGQGLHRIGGADGAADGDIGNAGERHDLTGGGGLNGAAAQARVLVQGHYLGLLLHIGVVVVTDHNFLVLADDAPLHAANGDTAHELIVIDGADQHLQGAVLVALGGIDILDDGVEQGLQIGAGHMGGIAADTLTGRAENGGRIELLLGGVQVQQQLQNLVADLVNALVGTVDLVDHNDDLVAQLQCLLQHEAGLGHGAFGGVHQQQNAVHHLEDTLHLAGEIGVARGVDNVDFHAVVVDGGILGQDRDAALPLQIAGVHHPVHDGLVLAVDTALLEHLIHQRRLAVVDVGDDCNVANVFLRHIKRSLPSVVSFFQ